MGCDCGCNKQEDLRGKSLDLGDLVQVQEGAVVSRQLISKPVGTITLFAFAGGEGLSEHSAPYDALVQVLEGKLVIKLAGVPHEVEAGQALIMPADVPHALDAPGDAKMMLVMIRE